MGRGRTFPLRGKFFPAIYHSSPSLPLEAKLAVQRCVTDHLPRLSSTLFMPLFFARSQGDTVTVARPVVQTAPNRAAFTIPAYNQSRYISRKSAELGNFFVIFPEFSSTQKGTRKLGVSRLMRQSFGVYGFNRIQIALILKLR